MAAEVHHGPLDFEAIAREWVRHVRGRRSQIAFSRRLGYRSSVVHRWETGAASPTAAAFLRACALTGKDLAGALTTFFDRRPVWLAQHGPASREGVAALLRQLRGNIRIGVLANASGYSRYRVARWLHGEAQPRLPEFLRLVEASSRRCLDLIATLHDPAKLPSASASWLRLQRMREAAYQEMWSHAVLRALELSAYSGGPNDTDWLAGVLGISSAQVERALSALVRTGQIQRTGDRWTALPATAVTTGRDPATAGVLTRAWTAVAQERLERKSAGLFGYSLFSISRADLRRLRDLQLSYLREMQTIIAGSEPNECVGLLCLQLLDLSEQPHNALG
ncbi:MAG: DUF4423 domain-containing protein [Myxococcales bacterium]|nr:DUF4423 domain-containing protein [Myxococcales bacterium]